MEGGWGKEYAWTVSPFFGCSPTPSSISCAMSKIWRHRTERLESGAERQRGGGGDDLKLQSRWSGEDPVSRNVRHLQVHCESHAVQGRVKTLRIARTADQS